MAARWRHGGGTVEVNTYRHMEPILYIYIYLILYKVSIYFILSTDAGLLNMNTEGAQ